MASVRMPVPLLLLLLMISKPVICSNATPVNEVDRQIKHARELFDAGNTAEAKKIFESLYERLRNEPPSTPFAAVLNGMSQIIAGDGDYDRAIQLAQQAADLYRGLNDPEGEAHAYNNRAIAELQKGSYAAAESDLEQALALSRRAVDPENETQIQNNLGSADYFTGRYSEAAQHYDAAMALVHRNVGVKWSDYWRRITAFNQATLYQRLGLYDKALEIYRGVQSSETLTPSDRAHLYANLGALYRRLGDPNKALESYRSARTLYKRQHDVGGEITVLKNIGIVNALDLENLDQAETIFRAALALAQKTHNRREEMQSHLYLGETYVRKHALDPARNEFRSALTLAQGLGTLEEQWKSLYGLGKVAEAFGNNSDAEAEYKKSISVIERTRVQVQLSALRTEFFADKRDAYDSLLSLLFEKKDIAGAFEYLERSRARNFQDRLAKFKGADMRPLTVQQAQSLLPAGTVLLEFWTAGERIGLIWCTRDRSGMYRKQLTAEERAGIGKFIDSLPSVFEGDWRAPMTVISRAMSLDVVDVDPSIKRFVIVPDGWISYVPLDLLSVPHQRDRLVIEDFEVSYLPTVTLLRRRAPDRPKILFPWSSELVAFGDPIFDGSAVSDPLRPAAGRDRLRFSAQEIRDVAGLANGKSQLFLEDRDQKKPFLGGTANQGILLHVSTHAIADINNPESSRLLFSPAKGRSAPDYVFLREVYDLDLSNVQLATISGCDTERGKLIRGEGVQAFSRALLSAGSQASLTTLWRVDDQPTAEFMQQFYFFALKRHETKAAALRLAKLKFLRSNSRLQNPAMWAAFVLSGDGYQPLPRVLSWTEVISALILAIVILTAMLLYLRRRRGLNRLHSS